LREAGKQTPDYPPKLKTATKAEYMTMVKKMDATGGGNGGGDNGNDDCSDKLFEFILLAITFVSLLHHWI
jgi:hypothetical protein